MDQYKIITSPPSVRSSSTTQTNKLAPSPSPLSTIHVESENPSQHSSDSESENQAKRTICESKASTFWSQNTRTISQRSVSEAPISIYADRSLLGGSSIGGIGPRKSILLSTSNRVTTSKSISFFGVDGADKTVEADMAPPIPAPQVLSCNADRSLSYSLSPSDSFHPPATRRIITSPYIASDTEGRLISSMNVGIYNEKEDEVPFHRQLQSDDMLRFLYRIFPNDARQVFVSQKTATRLDSFVRFIYLYRLKRANVSHLRCLEDVDAVVDSIKLCLKVTSRSTQHLVLLSNRLMKAVKICQRFIRRSLANLRNQKDAILHRWIVAETKTREHLSVEIESRKRALQCQCANSSQSKDIGKSMEELHLDCWTSTSKKIAAIESCWLERRDTYCARFRDWRANRISQIVHEMGLDGYQTLPPIPLPEDISTSKSNGDPSPKHKASNAVIASPSREVLPKTSVWARSALLRRGLLGYPQLHFRAEDISLKELCAHLQLCTLRAVVSSIPLASPEAIAFVRSQPLFVGDVNKLAKPVSYYHALMSLPCQKNDLIMLLLLRQQAMGEGSTQSSLPFVGPTTLKRLRAKAEEMAAHWHSGTVYVQRTQGSGNRSLLLSTADQNERSDRQESSSYGVRRHALAERSPLYGNSCCSATRRHSSSQHRSPSPTSHSDVVAEITKETKSHPSGADGRRQSQCTYRPSLPTSALVRSARPPSAPQGRVRNQSARARLLHYDAQTECRKGQHQRRSSSLALSTSLTAAKRKESDVGCQPILYVSAPPIFRPAHSSSPRGLNRNNNYSTFSVSTTDFSPIRQDSEGSEASVSGSPSKILHMSSLAPKSKVVACPPFDESRYSK